MSNGSNQVAFDDRLEQAVFSGSNIMESDEFIQLVKDYSRVPDARWSRTTGTSADDPSRNSSQSFSQRNISEESVDDMVAPLSKRRTNALHGIKQRSFSPLSEWEGYVESVSGEEFTLRLVNIKSGAELADEEATFSIRELSAQQRERLEVGAIIRWVIGLERLPTDQRRRVSELHFRRLPAHTTKDYERAFEKAQHLISEINWEDAS